MYHPTVYLGLKKKKNEFCIKNYALLYIIKQRSVRVFCAAAVASKSRGRRSTGLQTTMIHWHVCPERKIFFPGLNEIIAMIHRRIKRGE